MTNYIIYFKYDYNDFLMVSHKSTVGLDMFLQTFLLNLINIVFLMFYMML